MSFFGTLISPFKAIRIGRTDQFNDAITSYIGSGHTRYSSENAEQIATVHTCVKILAETISRMDLGTYLTDPDKGKLKNRDHYLYELLHYNPNPWTTSAAFMNALEANRNYKGNSYAKIHRNRGSGRVEMFTLVHPDRVIGYNIENDKLFYRVLKEGSNTEYDTVNAMDLLHFRGLTRDGIFGINPIEALRLNLSTTWEGLSTIDEFYQKSGVNPKAIKSTVAGANQKQMLEALEKLKKEYQGKKGAGDILPLPPNTEIQEMQMNAVDAVFLSMIEFNANQIAALYGIPAHLVGNMTTSKYNSIEATQISYKVNTVSAIARMYRQEFEYKCLTTKERKERNSIEFNTMSLVETDHKSRLEGYRILANIGAIKPNAIAILEGLETYPGGDDHYIQTNMMSVEKYNARNEKQDPPEDPKDKDNE